MFNDTRLVDVQISSLQMLKWNPLLQVALSSYHQLLIVASLENFLFAFWTIQNNFHVTNRLFTAQFWRCCGSVQQQRKRVNASSCKYWFKTVTKHLKQSNGKWQFLWFAAYLWQCCCSMQKKNNWCIAYHTIENSNC